MNLTQLRSLPPNLQALEVRRALDAKEIQPAEAAALATELQFPEWQQFAHLQVGTAEYGTAQGVATRDQRTLTSNSPLFVSSWTAPVKSQSKNDEPVVVQNLNFAEIKQKLQALVDDPAACEAVFGKGFRLRAEPETDRARVVQEGPSTAVRLRDGSRPVPKLQVKLPSEHDPVPQRVEVGVQMRPKAQGPGPMEGAKVEVRSTTQSFVLENPEQPSWLPLVFEVHTDQARRLDGTSVVSSLEIAGPAGASLARALGIEPPRSKAMEAARALGLLDE